jgi:hypothetical protein
MNGICRNCGKTRLLQHSHAIPNGFFRPIARAGGGQFIEINDGQSLARNSQDSGCDFLLCSQCEALFGSVFDAPLIDEVRNIRKAFRSGVKALASDPEKIKASISSILWRASVSQARLYRKFVVPSQIFYHLEREMWSIKGRNREFSYSVSPVYDKFPGNALGFSEEMLSNFILTPKPWNIAHGFAGRVRNGWGAIFLVGGAAIAVVQPRLSPYKERQNLFLNSDGAESHVRPIDMWSVPYVREFLGNAVRKERRESPYPGR